VVPTGGFSKVYSSLLAFVACPSELKRLLKVTAPPYLYSGPSPVRIQPAPAPADPNGEERGRHGRGALACAP
jgi:8-amino-7-oxononanoate synthase